MLTELELENFKAVKRASISLGRITVLIGENGSGKSSFLQALTLLKQSLGKAHLEVSGTKIELGSIRDILHFGDARNRIGIRLRVLGPLSEADQVLGDVVDATYAVIFDQQNISSHSLEVATPFELEASVVRGSASITPEHVPLPKGVSATFQGANRIAEPLGIAKIANGVGREDAAKFNIAVQEVLSAVRSVLLNTYYVPPVRGIESSSYAQEQQATEDFAGGLPKQASSILSTLTYDKELEAEISRLSELVLDLKIRTRAIPGTLIVAETHNGHAVNVVNEGYGLNQLLHLLAQVSVSKNNALLCIEEPEIHLHPAAQAALAGVLAELTENDQRQFLITTHSEHILLALLTYFGGRGSAAEHLQVYYFTRDKQTHVASAERLAVDKRGRIKGGLKGFFEANVAELGDYLKALSHETDTE